MKTEGKRMVMRYIMAVCIVFYLLIVAGCAKKNSIKNAGDEQVLRERIMAYWNHKINEEFDKSYEFEDPFYRKKISMGKYLRTFNMTKVRWIGAEIDSLSIDGTSADVAMRITIQITVSRRQQIEQDAFINEKWIKSDGIWHHVYQ